jgi:alkylhydroperoxidase family enzyme
MTRLPYRSTESMTEEARELTVERGSLNVYRALANAENVFTGCAALTSPVVSARLRELVILRTGHLMGSTYEVAQHSGIAEKAGLTATQLAALASDHLDCASFDETELAVLRLTTELINTKHVSAALFEWVHSVLGDEATMEVLMLIHRWSGLALMLNALDVDLDTDARISIPQSAG